MDPLAPGSYAYAVNNVQTWAAHDEQWGTYKLNTQWAMTNIQLHMNTIQDTAHKTYHNVMFDTYCTMVEIYVMYLRTDY